MSFDVDLERLLLGCELGNVAEVLQGCNQKAPEHGVNGQLLRFAPRHATEVSMIDIRELDWQENPHDAFGASATVEAGDRHLRIDAGFRPYFVQDTEPAPVTGIIEALRSGRDFKHMHAQAVPLDAEGNVFVNYAINSGHNPAVALNLESVETVNAQLADLTTKAADPAAPIYSAAYARRLENEARATELRTRAASLAY